VNQQRAVRVDPRFFEQLDLQLGPERGPLGEPSSTDFLLVDLPPIAETFAAQFTDLQMPSRAARTIALSSPQAGSFLACRSSTRWSTM